MFAAFHPEQERRLAALRDLEILDTEPEREYDELVELVSEICQAPIAVVNLIDADRQWFKAEKGLGVRSTPLESSICAHVILEGDYVEIPDTLADSRMRDNPLCTAAGGLRFYAGTVLKTEEGLPVGTLCVLDTEPRRLDDVQRRAIGVLGRQAMRLLDLRLSLKRQDLLAREIDHRVKNSLASVAAIVRLQANRSGSEGVRAALDQVQARLSGIAALHEELHQTAPQPTVSLARFLERLRNYLGPLLPDGTAFEVSADDVEVRSEIASAVGLAVNEFIANAAKHGLPDDGSGTIALSEQVEGSGCVVRCCHDGPADAATLEAIETGSGLGTRIIGAAMQSIRGQANWSLEHPGLRLELTFPVAP